MAEKVKVNPSVCAAPFSAAQNSAVELSGKGQVCDVEGEVEKAFHGVSFTQTQLNTISSLLLI